MISIKYSLDYLDISVEIRDCHVRKLNNNIRENI